MGSIWWYGINYYLCTNTKTNKIMTTMIIWVKDNKRDVIEGVLFFSILIPFLYTMLSFSEAFAL